MRTGRIPNGTDDSGTTVLLLRVFKMPSLALLKIVYSTASCPGGLINIVGLCEQLIADNKPLPDSILAAQKEMHK